MKSFNSLAFLSLMGLVSACSTPLENCVSGAQSDFYAVQNAIEVGEQNVARGYAINTQRVPYQRVGYCYNYTIGSYSCMQNAYRTEETPVAIDVNEERRKIREYRAALPNIKKQAEAATAMCQQTHPAK